MATLTRSSGLSFLYSITMLAAALALAAGCSGAPGAGGALEVSSVPLRPEKYHGVVLDGSELTLMDEAIVQADPNYIVVEAEDALEYEFQQYIGVLKAGRSTRSGDVVQEYARDTYEYGPQEAEDASAGQYIDFTNYARYAITVTEPGEYTVWARHWMPRTGFWAYNHQLDGQRSARIDIPLREQDEIRRWFWVKTHTVTLSKGTHAYAIADLCNGKRLDKLVFHRDPNWTPEGVGPEAAPKRALDEGWVEFATLEPAGLKQWSGIERALRLYRGAVTFDVSDDNGATWQALPADNRLPDRLRQAPALRFRALFTRAEGRPSPRLTRADVQLVVSPGAFATLETDYYRLTFDRATGAVVGMTNLKTGADIVDRHLPPVNPLSIFIKQPGQEGRWLNFSDAVLLSFDANAKRVVSRYAFHGGQIEATCTFEAVPGMESRWSVTINNRSEYDVLHVRYPQIERVALDGDSSDDVLMWPNLGGVFYPVPAQGTTLVGGYPAHLGLGFVNIFDETGGLSIALDDEFVVSSHLHVQPSRCKQSMTMRWEKRHRIRAHGGSQSYNFLVGVHPGDWREAARLYRESFYRKFPKPDYPDWIIESDGWVYGGVGIDSGHNLRWYDEIRSRGWMGALDFGNDYIHLWGSTFAGACPTYYLPRKECGGAEVFEQRNREFREAGGHIGYYFHGNAIGGAYTLMDTYFQTPWSDYPEEVRPPSWDWYVRNRLYPDEETTVGQERKDDYLRRIDRWKNRGMTSQASGLDAYPYMSYHTGEFFDWLTEWTDRYIVEYSTNTIYYDTMAWGADKEEYNPFGDYHGEGDRAMIKMQFLSDNIERLRPQEPEFAQLTEGCTDLWNIYCYSLISGFTRHGMQDVVRYTFPEMIFIDGNANGRWGEQTHKDSLAGAWLMGNKFDLIVRSDWSERLMALRQLASPLLARARFESHFGIDLSDSGVQARGHILEDDEGTRAMLVTLWNRDGREGCNVYVDTRHYGTTSRYYMLEQGADPKPVEPRREGNFLIFEAPTATCSALVGVDDASPSRALAVSLRYDGKHAVARVMNYAARPMTAEFRVEADGVTFAESVKRIEVPVGYSQVVFTPTNADELNVRQILKLDVEAGGHSRRHLTWVGPIIDDGIFEYFHDFSVTTDKAYTGRTSRLVGVSPEPLTRAFTPPDEPLTRAGYFHRNFISWPHNRYRVTLATKGGVQTPHMLFEWQSDQRGTIPMVRAGEEQGWTLWQLDFDGRGHGRIIVRAQGDGPGYIDALRAVVVGPAQGGEAGAP